MSLREWNQSYLPATDADVSAMLARIGLPSLDALFGEIPQALRLDTPPDVPPAADEWRLTREMRAMSASNLSGEQAPCFLGGGAYDHFIPSAVSALTGRSEFWTAYTPYQAEMSQGMLQAIFEYQSLVSALSGMDGANASLYDGATALVEGALLAMRATGRNRLLVSRGVNPEYRRVLADALRHADAVIVEVPVSALTGRVDAQAPAIGLMDGAAAFIVQTPNFFGIPEDVAALAGMAHAAGALLCVSADPVSLGVLEAPGRLGADIYTGEGQPLGMPMSFGGPYLGLFAVKAPLIRQMPGRIVGETADAQGRRGFVLTLQAREQHIRRERAASNICSNQALCALTATIHLSLLGPEGLARVARQSLGNAVYLQGRLLAEGLAEPVFTAPFFREFAVRPVLPPSRMNGILQAAGIIGGLDLTERAPEMTRDGQAAWLVAVTEKRSREEMDRFVEVLASDAEVRAARRRQSVAMNTRKEGDRT